MLNLDALQSTVNSALSAIETNPDALNVVLSRSADGFNHVASIDALAAQGMDRSGEDNFTKYPIMMTRPNTGEVVEAFIQDIQKAVGENDGEQFYEIGVSLLLNDKFLPEIEITRGVLIHKKCIGPKGCHIKWENVCCTQINWIDGKH